MRLLVLALGVTMQATSCILVIFLGGLALGAAIAGKLADRLGTKSLTAYGVVELAVGLLAPIVTNLTFMSPRLLVSLLHLLPDNTATILVCRLLISIMVLLPPTILMGASLPFLTRFLTEKHMSAQEFFSHLYGINTFGGVCGSLAACYLGFPYLGLSNTILVAATINVVVGISSIVIGTRQISEPSPVVPAQSPAAEELQGEKKQPSQLMWLYMIAGLTGFTALSYEVLWTRMLIFATSSSTYAFTAIVSTFLIGLTLGSFIYHRLSRKWSSNIDEHLRKFALIQYLCALACTASLLCLPVSFLFFLMRTAGSGPLSFATAVPGHLGGILLLSFVTTLFMLVPSTLIGISFPMITSLSTALTKNVSTAVGNAFAANTIGCVLGSVMAGLVLIPRFGSYTAFQITIVETVATGALAIAICRSISLLPKLAWSIMPIACAVLFAVFAHVPLKTYLPAVSVVRCGEDGAGTLFVLRWPDHLQLLMNGDSYSTTIMRGRRYMRLLGHLPALLHKNPEDALVICFGMGTTAGAIAANPQVKSLDIVELSPLVIDCGNLFSQTNYDVLNNTKAHVHIEDGRNFLLRSNKLYDFITLEPPPPCDSGMTNLYSSEFYALMRERLKPGGLVCQWVPMSEMAASQWKMMIAAAEREFPEVSLWEPNNGEGIIVCSTAPLKIDFHQLSERIVDPRIRQSLTDVGLGSASALLSTYINSGQTLRNFVAGVPALTDDRAQIEFGLPYRDSHLFNFDLESISTPIAPVLANVTQPDLKELANNRQAMKLLRQATQAKVDGDGKKAEVLIDKALVLVPDNEFFEYAKKHADQVLQ